MSDEDSLDIMPLTEAEQLIADTAAEEVSRRAGETPKYNKNGRKVALRLLDHMLSDAKNIAALHDGLRQALLDRPVEFYKTVVMPLMPRSLVDNGAGEGDGEGDGEGGAGRVMIVPDNGRMKASLLLTNGEASS